jgi:hypothetical protein
VPGGLLRAQRSFQDLHLLLLLSQRTQIRGTRNRVILEDRPIRLPSRAGILDAHPLGQRQTTMKSKIAPVFKALIFVAGAGSLQACFYGGHHRAQPAPYGYSSGPAYGYAPQPAPQPEYRYAPPPAYKYAPPPQVGDYDEHHQWHDRDWWVRHNRPWVQQHHPAWLASQGHGHDNDHDNH